MHDYRHDVVDTTERHPNATARLTGRVDHALIVPAASCVVARLMAAAKGLFGHQALRSMQPWFLHSDLTLSWSSRMLPPHCLATESTPVALADPTPLSA